MQRLITLEDLQKYPELSQRGISVNQHFDLDAYIQQKGNSIPPSAPIPPPVAQMKPQFQQPEIRTMIPEKQVVGKVEKAAVAATKPKVKERAPKAIAPKKQEVVKVKKAAPKKIIPIKTAPKKTTKGKKK